MTQVTLPEALPLTEKRLAPWNRPRKFTAGLGSAGASSAFLMPIIAVFVVLFAIPLTQTFYYSFTDFNGLSPDKYFVGRNISRSVIFFVGVPSQVILGLVWQYIFSPLKSGALNTFLGQLGIGPVPWLADSLLAQFCVIFVAVWAGVGWHAMLYIAYLQAIPSDLYEQAQIDGANERQQFFHITLPQLVPAIIVSSFLLVTSGLKIYDLPFAMTKGGPGFATNTITQSIITRGLAQSDYGVGSALAVLFTLASIGIILGQLSTANAISRRFS